MSRKYPASQNQIRRRVHTTCQNRIKWDGWSRDQYPHCNVFHRERIPRFSAEGHSSGLPALPDPNVRSHVGHAVWYHGEKSQGVPYWGLFCKPDDARASLHQFCTCTETALRRCSKMHHTMWQLLSIFLLWRLLWQARVRTQRDSCYPFMRVMPGSGVISIVSVKSLI